VRGIGCGHHQQVRRVLRLGREQQPLRHPEAMLLVNDGQAKFPVSHLFLEDRVGADQDVDRAVRKPHQHALASAALLPAGEDRDTDADAVELLEQRRMVLAGKDFGWGEQRRLRAGFHRRQHRQHRHQSLARPDVPLQQPQHRCGLCHVPADFLGHAALGAGELVREPQLCSQFAAAGQRVGAMPPLRLAQHKQRELVGEHLVIGEPLARFAGVGLAMDQRQRRAPRLPMLA